MDLYSAVYQNYMSPDAHPHLSLMPPFSGLFVLACSGQGLLGQSGELDELISKIFKDKL